MTGRSAPRSYAPCRDDVALGRPRRQHGRRVEVAHRRAGLSGQHVDGDLEEDRAARGREGAAPGLRDQLGDSEAASARAAHLTTGSKEAFWSASSWRNPRPAPDQLARDPPDGDHRDVGARGLHEAASEMSAPGPVERRSGAAFLLVRA